MYITTLIHKNQIVQHMQSFFRSCRLILNYKTGWVKK